MKTEVYVSLPSNTKQQDLSLFSPHTTYKLENLKILRLSEVFVTYSGLCLNEVGLIRESVHDDLGKYQQMINEAAYFVRLSLKGKIISIEDDNKYLLIHHPWSSNYWHWITEALLRVWIVRNDIKDMILVLPEHFKHIDFVTQSLSAFQFKGTIYLPYMHSAQIKNLVLPQIKGVCDSYYPHLLNAIRNKYLQFVAPIKFANSGLERIYISRRIAAKRRVSNDEQVEKILVEYGFVSLCNEQLSYLEQIKTFSTARYLVSIHGAGLTNMLFMKSGSTVLEFHKRKTNKNDWHSFAYWYMADALGFRYFHQICDPIDSSASFLEADLVVDLEELRLNLENMFDFQRCLK